MPKNPRNILGEVVTGVRCIGLPFWCDFLFFTIWSICSCKPAISVSLSHLPLFASFAAANRTHPCHFQVCLYLLHLHLQTQTQCQHHQSSIHVNFINLLSIHTLSNLFLLPFTPIIFKKSANNPKHFYMSHKILLSLISHPPTSK